MSHTMSIDPTGYTVLHCKTGNVGFPLCGQKRSALLKLPDEILLGIVQHIDQKRDLLNLCLTCRKLEDVAIQRLYERVEVLIPQSRSPVRQVSSMMPNFRSHVFNFLRELTVRNGPNEAVEPVRSGRTFQGHVHEYIYDLIRRIPHNHLKSFVLLHQSPLTLETLSMLAKDQSPRLEHIHCFEVQADGTTFDVPQSLQTLRCRSVQTGDIVSKMLESNCDSLQALLLGQERALFENYQNSRSTIFDQIQLPPVSSSLLACIPRLSKLRRLTMVGLDLQDLTSINTISAPYLARLEKLDLESCTGTADFLNMLQSTFNHANNLASTELSGMRHRLKSFSFRHEALTGTLKESLIQFLTSFDGLEELSLLFDNTSILERPSVFIAGHGSTLKTLVLETRVQSREHLGLDTSRPFGSGGYAHQRWQESIGDVCSLCPNLVELGMAFPWDDEAIRVCKTKLPQLKRLRTIHIRNFPQSQVLSQLGDYAIREYARKFAEWNYPSLIGSGKPALEFLAIGPTLYATRWKCSFSNANPNRSPSSSVPYRHYSTLPEYLRSHYFCLDWAKTRFERWHAMITPLAESHMEELRDERPLSGVFEHVWMK